MQRNSKQIVVYLPAEKIARLRAIYAERLANGSAWTWQDFLRKCMLTGADVWKCIKSDKP